MSKNIKTLIFCLGLLLSLGLGMHGWSRLDPASPLTNNLYLTIQLFTLESGHVDEVVVIPISLEIARYLAPLTTASGILLALHQFLLIEGRNAKRKMLKNHIVVVGGNERALTLGRDLKSAGFKVMILLTTEGSNVAEYCWNEGFIAVEVSESAQNLVEIARLKHARRVIVFTEDDYTNLKLALTFKAGNKEGNIPISINLDSEELCHTVQNQYDYIYAFNYYRCVSRVLLSKYPLEAFPEASLCAPEIKDIRLIISHWDLLSKAFLYQVAKVGHYKKCRKVKVFLVCEQAELVDELITTAYPNIRKCIDLELRESRNQELIPNIIIDLLHSFPDSALTTILYLSDAPEDSFAGSARVKEKCSIGHHVRMLIPQSPLSNSADEKHLHVLPESTVFCNASILLNDSIDLLASTIHQSWYDATLERLNVAKEAKDEKTIQRFHQNPYFKPWDRLKNAQKEENRAAADHMAIKLRALDLQETDPMMLSLASLEGSVKSIDEEQMEILAAMEHRRWAAVKWMTGWEKGPRDDAGKKHPDLVPYDDLDEPTKQYDRDQVKGIIALVKTIQASRTS
jgi:hypothetical protein